MVDRIAYCKSGGYSMITSTNRKISVIAYFISKYDKEAINALGYETYTITQR